jgi:hypothetical protein
MIFFIWLSSVCVTLTFTWLDHVCVCRIAAAKGRIWAKHMNDVLNWPSAWFIKL